jgi:hypothetical protein
MQDYGAMVRALMMQPQMVGDVVGRGRFPGSDVSQNPPMPDPNNGYMPSPSELEMLKRILPQVIPFPTKR